MNNQETPTLILEAGRADGHYWRDLWQYRELLGFLAWRDIKVRYKQAVLGFIWAVLQPAVQTVLLTFVFQYLAGMSSGSVSYPLIVLSGLIPWLLFSNAFNGCSNSLVGNSHLISKVYFPRLIVPLSSLAVALADLLILLCLFIPLAAVMGVAPGWRLLLLPFFIALTLMIALGAGLWITSLTIKYRDFRFVTQFLLQVGLFVTPVGFRIDNLPNRQLLLAFNPLTGAIDGFRWCLLNGSTDLFPSGIAISIGITALLVFSGFWFFRKVERSFADII